MSRALDEQHSYEIKQFGVSHQQLRSFLGTLIMYSELAISPKLSLEQQTTHLQAISDA